MGMRVSPTLVMMVVCGSFGAALLAGCKGDIPEGGGKQPDPMGASPGNPGMGNVAPGMGAPGGGAVAPGMGAPGGGAVAPGMGGGAAPAPVMPTMPVPLPPPVMPPAQSDEDMPADVQALLRSRCAGCHTYSQADPAGWGSVLDVSRMIDADIVVPGRPQDSRMIDRVAVAANMPPKGARLTGDEVSLLKNWISNLKRNADNPPSDNDILDMIASDQLRLRGRSSDYRYVSFAHYVGQGRPEAEMKSLRQVALFVINSLSRKGAVADLPTIDPDGSVFRIDLADLGWDANLWDTLTSFYPYCIVSDVAAHEALYEQLDTEVPVVRGDWLLATATKAPLYDQLVDLPNTIDQLAARLGININNDINHPGLEEPDNLVRVGFRRSGVMLHNRMVERHLGNAGQYMWISYDFNSSQGRQDVLSNPLGPDNRDQQNFQNTFQHVSSEVIFTLPNGLQGYMVVDGNGRRLAVESAQVVRDPNRRDGLMQNGLSCFACHAGPGLVRPRATDEVALFADTHIAQFLGRELDEITSTYPKVLRPDLFNTDGARYRAITDSSPGMAPPAGDGGYAGYLTALGHYESNVGFHGAAAEFNQEYRSLRDTIMANDSQNESLPRTINAPLVSRDDFVCVWRDLITKIRPNARFCANSFNANAVRNLCQ
jgi:mono/diheme cytochrome c family protein